MPTYDFRCPNGHDFEKFYRKISDAESELPCPECGAAAQRRVSGGAGLVFKGSGFYLTDYGKDAHRKPAPSGTSKEDGKEAAQPKRETASEAKGESTGGGGSATKRESKAPEPPRGRSEGGAGAKGSSGE